MTLINTGISMVTIFDLLSEPVVMIVYDQAAGKFII
jgi:hypothetical protein